MQHLSTYDSPRTGFTLVELMVVIAIIGLLASVVLLGLTTARQRAQATLALQNFNEIEKALILFAHDQDIALWWGDNEDPVIPTCGSALSCGSVPPIHILVGGPFGEFMGAAPETPPGEQYRYKNNASYSCGTCGSCGGETDDGVTIQLTNVDSNEIFEHIDSMVDSGDGADCGKIRRSEGMPYHLYYSLSDDGVFRIE